MKLIIVIVVVLVVFVCIISVLLVLWEWILGLCLGVLVYCLIWYLWKEEQDKNDLEAADPKEEAKRDIRQEIRDAIRGHNKVP